MLTFQGKSVFGGIAIGNIHVLQMDKYKVEKIDVENIQAELERFHMSQRQASKQLEGIYQNAVLKLGEAEASIFEIHKMLLYDTQYVEFIESKICLEKVNAEYAVKAAGEYFYQLFSNMEDDYMRERAADIRDISARILGIMIGRNNESLILEEPAIIVAEDLLPSQTVQLDEKKVLAFVTRQGSVNSHTAILARTMNIPALVRCDIEIEKLNGSVGIVDGTDGMFYVEPDDNCLEQMKNKQKEEEQNKVDLQAMRGKPSVTADGKKIKLYANIGGIKDLDKVLENDAEGIGLFRSEFLYLGREDYPTEEEQFIAYKTVAEAMEEKEVIIRTLDIGADKKADYFCLEHEENPAMGYRAIRICLARPEIFKTQLRALLRASAYGNIAIMYPMIISVEEVRQIKKLVLEVKAQLDEVGISYGSVKQGIMIETPAAVMVSEELAKEVDFFSIGTNDLTQYTLAVDRQNPRLDDYYDSYHPAIFKMIQMVVDSAHKAGIPVGICGELGGDEKLMATFLEMGVDELSVAPARILPLRKLIREM